MALYKIYYEPVARTGYFPEEIFIEVKSKAEAEICAHKNAMISSGEDYTTFKDGVYATMNDDDVEKFTIHSIVRIDDKPIIVYTPDGIPASYKLEKIGDFEADNCFEALPVPSFASLANVEYRKLHPHKNVKESH